MKIAVLTWEAFHGREKGTVGSSLIRGEWLCAADNRFFLWKHGIQYDALILQKCYWRDVLDDFKGPIILDMCDPDWLSGEFDLVEISKKVKAITCSSEALANTIRKYVKCPVVHVPDRVNFNAIPSPKPFDPQRPKTAVWYGYIHNWSQAVTDVLDGLKSLNLGLRVISNGEFNPMNPLEVPIENVKWVAGECWREIQRGDIILNPQYPGGRFIYKSNNKTVIGAALGVPVATTFTELTDLIDTDKRKDWLDKSKEWLKDYDIKLSVEQYLSIFNDY